MMCLCPDETSKLYRVVLNAEESVSGNYTWSSVLSEPVPKLFEEKSIQIIIEKESSSPTSDRPEPTDNSPTSIITSLATKTAQSKEANRNALLGVCVSLVLVIIVVITLSIVCHMGKHFKVLSLRRMFGQLPNQSRRANGGQGIRPGVSLYRGSNVSLTIINDIYQGVQDTRRDATTRNYNVEQSVETKNQTTEEEGDYAEIDDLSDTRLPGAFGAQNMYVSPEEVRRKKNRDRPLRCNVKVSVP
ncbi:uncharacterized protein [Littorina saxatilis]|uniref:uncharacterized protein n=1 Tax=Littorina saxatilis TaxID=31220 RepID=UPI0038B48B93